MGPELPLRAQQVLLIYTAFHSQEPSWCTLAQPTDIHPRPRFLKDGHLLVFPIQKCGYFVKVKDYSAGLRNWTAFMLPVRDGDHVWSPVKSRDCAET